jgi:hypothetical protein
MPPMGVETTISAGERRQPYGLDRAATETGQEEHNIAIIQINRLQNSKWNTIKTYQFTVINYNFVSQYKICKTQEIYV